MQVQAFEITTPGKTKIVPDTSLVVQTTTYMTIFSWRKTLNCGIMFSSPEFNCDVMESMSLKCAKYTTIYLVYVLDFLPS